MQICSLLSYLKLLTFMFFFSFFLSLFFNFFFSKWLDTREVYLPFTSKQWCIVSMLIPVVVFYYTFARCIIGENWVKDTVFLGDLFVLFLLTVCKSIIVIKLKLNLNGDMHVGDLHRPGLGEEQVTNAHIPLART